MPNMADLTIKKNDGTTDVVFTALVPSSGDTVAAQWRSETQGSVPAYRPKMTMTTRFNGQKTARRADVHFEFPFGYTDSTTGLAMSKDKVVMDLSIVSPQQIPQVNVDEAVAQFANLLKAALIQQALKSGYAPT